MHKRAIFHELLHKKKRENTKENVISHLYRTVLAGKFEICCSGKADHEDKLKPNLC